MGQRDIAYDRGARGSDCVFDLRTLQVLTIRVLDGHSPCDFVGVGVIRTVFRDASLKFGFHRLPSGVIGTRFIQEFNGTVTGGIVFGYLNTIGQLIFCLLYTSVFLLRKKKLPEVQLYWGGIVKN